MELVFIRHAESANNRLWAETGASVGRSPDPELTDLGGEQARALAEWVAADPVRLPLTHLYTSLMARAVQTAVPLAEVTGLPLVGRTDVFEVAGPFEEDPDSGVRTPFPGLGHAGLRAHAADLRLPPAAGEDGWWRGPVEEAPGAAERARAVVRDLQQNHGPDDVVGVVTHGLFCQYLFRHLLGAPDMSAWIVVNNTGVSRFVVGAGSGETVALSINRLDHLGPSDITE